MPLFQSRGRFADQTYQSRYLESFDERASLNHGCSIGGVVHHQIGDDADAALVGGARELDEVAQRPIARVDAVIVGDVIAVVAVGRGVERHQPDAVMPRPAR